LWPFAVMRRLVFTTSNATINHIFQPKTYSSTAIMHIRLLLILFIISQWVYQMIIQAHLGIIMALEVMLGWRDKQAVGKIWRFLSNFSPKNLLIKSHQAHI
jgi:hypothetical protein